MTTTELKLDETQREVLKEAIQRQLSDLSYQIADSDRLDYCKKLRERRETLQGILGALD
jgi:hypothetical protein